MKITQSWKRNTPTTDGYSLTITYIYSSKYLHEIEEVESKLPRGMLVMDTYKPERMYPLEQDVEPKQKQGRWIKMTGMMPPEYHGHYECSECQWHMKGIRNSWTREEEFTYCPNCGTAMLEGGTDEAN